MRRFDNIDKQLTGVNKVALGFDGIVFYIFSNNVVAQRGIINTVVATLKVIRKVLADKAIEQRAQYILFKIPAIYRATYIIGNLPDLAL